MKCRDRDASPVTVIRRRFPRAVDPPLPGPRQPRPPAERPDRSRERRLDRLDRELREEARGIARTLRKSSRRLVP